MTYKSYLELHKQLQSTGLLTERVFALPERVYTHPIISKYLSDNSRYIIVYSGRQSFKSEICKRKIVQEALSNPKHRILIGAPTHAQVKKIYWTGPLNVPDMIPACFIRSISHSEYRITLINGSTIELFSAESPTRAEGSWANLVVIDEAGDCNLQEVLQRTVYPMTTPVHGKIYLIGVPRQSMSGFYKELAQKYCDKKKYPEWSCYTWPAIDVLDPEEIRSIKEQIDPLLFEQEYGGQFHSGMGGLAYHQYSKEKHVAPVDYVSGLPLFVSLDFNISYMGTTIGQIHPSGKIAFLDEVVTRHANIFDHIPLLKKKLIEICGSVDAAKKRGTFLYGDHTGNSLHVSAKGSVWTEIKNMFSVDGWAHEIRTKPNPFIDRRIASVNAKLCSADKNTHIRINPKCKSLIRDFELISWADLQRDKSKLEAQELTHTSDAVGYLIFYHYPLSSIIL